VFVAVVQSGSHGQGPPTGAWSQAPLIVLQGHASSANAIEKESINANVKNKKFFLNI
jgi:hypothetical protein